jgi:exosortase/archaeosortase family protein
MVKKRNEFFDIIIRYLILILVAIPNLWIFYFIFKPLTVYPVFALLNLFFDASLISSDIILIAQEIPIELIKACIAGAAYYLLLILNLSTPKIKINDRIKMIFIAFLAFLVVNILRIFILSIIVVNGAPPEIFDATHELFWYLISTLFVVGIWFAEVKLFKIKEIPFYSDLKYLYKKSRLK